MNGAANTQENDEIDLLKVFDVLWAGRRAITGAAVMGVVLAWLYVVSTPPTYQASGLLHLEERSSGIALSGAMADLMGEKIGAVTQIAIVRSRMVLDQASQKLRLDIIANPISPPLYVNVMRAFGVKEPLWDGLVKYPWGDETMSVSGLSVPPSWENKSITVTQGKNGAYSITLPDGQELEGQVGTTLNSPSDGFAVLIDQINASEGRQFQLRKRSLAASTAAILASLTVKETERQSSMLALTVKASSPVMAEQTLDAVAEAYVAQNISRSAAEAENSLDFINSQLPIAEDAFRKAQTALNDYQSRQQSVDIEFEAQALLGRVTDIERQLSTLELEQTALSQKVTENHPEFLTLQQNRQALETQLEELKAQVRKLPDTQQEVFNFSRDLELAQESYIQLLSRAQELQVVRASAIGSVRIIDRGQAASGPISPKKQLIIAMGLGLGGILGMAYVGIRHLLRKGVRSSAELKKLGLPVFATINLSKEAQDHHKQRGQLKILALSHPDELVVEAFRSLRTSLHFGMLDARTNSLMLTSSAPGAGKSFTAINLAVVAAQSGQKVCLIDADLRRGHLRRYFGVAKNHPGLSELLTGEKALEQVTCAGPVAGLDFISTGRFPPNPSELLMRSTLQTLLEEMDKTYDLIILDTPPVLAVTDPVVISRAVGASITVVRHMVTPVGEVEAVLDAMASAGAKMSGAILNAFDIKAMGLNAAGSYNYRYAYQSDKSSED